MLDTVLARGVEWEHDLHLESKNSLAQQHVAHSLVNKHLQPTSGHCMHHFSESKLGWARRSGS